MGVLGKNGSGKMVDCDRERWYGHRIGDFRLTVEEGRNPGSFRITPPNTNNR